ncbi:acyl-homoserine-lactone synthase [Variovorax sp. DT-64]|uniref:acyl-homoserine-lactone synthase n=1 Tax=Variovorax sp. DT-64 TaxID=3396160 RepID=UPI003F1CDF31
MEIITGTADTLPQGLLLESARYRHRVFVERLGWKLQTSGGLEFDEFDRPDTRYVIACDAHARIIGSARLLPTLGPYLLADVFPQLLDSKDPPRANWLWELSRFAALDLHSRRGSQQHGLASPHAFDLLAAATALAAQHGVRQLISVSPLGIERILKAAGVDCRRAGEARMVQGQALFACLIDVDEDWRAPRQAASTNFALRDAHEPRGRRAPAETGWTIR